MAVQDPDALPQHRDKMAKLPASAKVQKRPLHRPAIPSPYTSSSETKVVYVSTKTPFISAVKRVDKLLRLAEKRAVQSAAATARNENPRKRKRPDEDDIGNIAHMLREQTEKEAVVVKGTGKAIVKALELGSWFQQRAEYDVKIRTGTVESIDDIEIDEPAESTTAENDEGGADAPDAMDVTEGSGPAVKPTQQQKKPPWVDDPNQRDETRVRMLSVIEVLVTLK